MDFTPGSKFARYEILAPIGAGGMGRVYLARDPQLRRPVALKVLGSHVVASGEHRERLTREAQTASALNHPNILTVYEVGQVDDHPFIATEFVEGMTLRKRLAAQALEAGEILDIASQVARALSAAESAGVVHCDIKPDNIMLRNDGYVKVLDFGLAFVRDPLSIEELSQPGVVRGTIQYMSPEQLRLEQLDSRTDIWSLGVVLYEALAGKPPFEGGTVGELIAAILTADPRPIASITGRSVPAPFERIVTRCLARDRNGRYLNVNELISDLKHASIELQGLRHLAVGTAAASAEVGTDDITLSASDSSLARELRARDVSPRSGNLPVEVTPFIGRETEQQSLATLVQGNDARLVTLTGPGGTGKTRLALHVARSLAPAFPDGVWIADLSTISDSRLVPSAIAASLQINEAGSASVTDLLIEQLKSRRLLLILDNFEQVTAAAPVVSRLLAEAPALRLFVTSRTRLRLAGEQEFPVPPLSIPDASESRLDELERHSAVALFVQRASAAKPDFALSDENAEQIAAICRHLDGLPLAIELAAARIRLLPPSAMLSRLENRFSLLSGGPTDRPDRQRTMYGAIAWGHNLLDDIERTLFARLSVFAGGFTLDAAEDVCGAGGDTLEILASLVDKSFVKQDAASDGEPRFSLLETIRDFGHDRLAEAGEVEATREKHARHFARLAHRAEEASKESQVAWLDILDREHQNIRLALEWAIAQSDAHEALRIAGSLWWFWYLRGHYAEGRRWLGRALARDAARKLPVRARALTGAGVMAFLQCDYAEAATLLEESVDLSRQTGDLRNRAQALQFLGSVARERGDYDHAIDLHQFALTLFGQLGDSTGVARSLNYVGFSSWLKGDFERAATVCGETLATFNASQDGEGSSWSLLNLAAVALYEGNYESGMKLAKQSLAAAREARFQEGIAWALDILGRLSRHRGDHDRGEAFLRVSLEHHFELGDRWRTASVLEAIAGYAVDLGQTERAATLFGAARAIREQLGTPVPLAEKATVETDLATLASAMPVADRESAELVGRSIRLADAVAFALRREG